MAGVNPLQLTTFKLITIKTEPGTGLDEQSQVFRLIRPKPLVQIPTIAPLFQRPSNPPAVRIQPVILPAPNPTVVQPAPNPTVALPAPNPTVAQPAPNPTVPQPAPNPTVAQPAPNPTVPQPAPNPTVIQQQSNSSVSEAQTNSPVLELTSTAVRDEKVFSYADTTSLSSPCLLPSSNFSGEYNFDIYFESAKSEAKKVGWTYSEERNKLYVAKDHPIPINFVTGRPTPNNTKIRLTAVFALPEHANEVVRRCINHSFMDLNNGIYNPDHVIRCEWDQAVYETDEVTERRSVVLPYTHPTGVDEFSTYIFKFVCFGSCTGGLNRRPIKIIFTLETNKVVIGRRTLDVKICACPWRDCKNEDRQSNSSGIEEMPSPHPQQKESKKRKIDSSDSPFPEISKFINSMRSKKHKLPPNDGPYSIVVNDRKLYDFLKQIKKLYELHETLESLNPSIISALKKMQLTKVLEETTSDSVE